MPEHAEFRAFYLSEIGVHTPLPVDKADSSSQITDKIKPEGAPVAPSSVSSQSQPVSPPVHLSSTTSSEHVPDVSVDSGVGAAADINGLKEMAAQASTCTACQLSEQRNNVVFGVGSSEADIVFIGEAPGEEEDLQGEPFVGQSGHLLDRMLASLGMDRSQVYIMNRVKCRPPNNRDPKSEEIEACGKWFDAQLKALSPKLICLLGRVAAQTVLETDASLSAMRGKWHDYHGIPVKVIYHPAYLLRSPKQKTHAWNDLTDLKRRYQSLSS
ncbi:MAG: uracil-DNA glycosylase [Mariprofundaceae bacterium]